MRRRSGSEVAGMVQAVYNYHNGAQNRQGAYDLPVITDFAIAYEALVLEARGNYQMRCLVKFIDKSGDVRSLLESVNRINPIDYQKGVKNVWDTLEAHLVVRRAIDQFGCEFDEFDRALGISSANRWYTLNSLIFSFDVMKALNEAEKSNCRTLAEFGDIYKREVR